MLDWIIALLLFLLVLFGYGKHKEKKGEENAEKKLRESDTKTAAEFQRKLDAVRRDGDAVERLRKRGKLRE